MLSIDAIATLTFVSGTAIATIIGLLIGIVSWNMFTKRKYDWR